MTTPDNNNPSPQKLLEKLTPGEQELLQALLAKASTANIAVDGVANRPAGWRQNSYAPYYRKRFALEVRVIFDLLIEQARLEPDVTVRKGLYIPKNQLRGNIASNIQRFGQGSLYLIEQLHKDDKYADIPVKDYFQLRQAIEICRHHSGIMFRWKSSPLEEAEGAPTNYQPIAVKGTDDDSWKWKGQLEDFIATQTEPGELSIKGDFSEEDVAYIQGLFEGLVEFRYRIGADNKYIKVVRTDSVVQKVDNWVDGHKGVGEV